MFLASGFLGIGLGDVALFQTLPRLGSRLSMLLIQCLTAPIGALIERVWLGTSLAPRQVFCGFTILVGVGIALTPGEHLKITRRDKTIGIAFALLAAFGGACGAVLSRKAYALAHAAQEPIDGGNAAFQRIVGGLLIGGLCLLVVKRSAAQATPLREEQWNATRQKWRKVWPWVLANSLAGQTFGVSCMQWALESLPTGIVLAIIATTPIVVIPFAFVFEAERPTRLSLIGGAIAVAGVVALALGTRRA
jgi:drug/metabolite transporter (DMT)-like permease